MPPAVGDRLDAVAGPGVAGAEKAAAAAVRVAAAAVAIGDWIAARLIEILPEDADGTSRGNPSAPASREPLELASRTRLIEAGQHGSQSQDERKGKGAERDHDPEAGVPEAAVQCPRCQCQY
jgi:hypothetical protein